MDAERWRRIKGLLDAVAELSTADREAHLVEVCGDDRDLRWDVERLLAFEEEAEEFIERPAWQGDSTAVEAEPEAARPATQRPENVELTAGDRIGPYRVERLLGEGGMGQVFLAIREDDFRQRVAIKRMAAGALGRVAKARFLHERQILADLQHPLIARLLDGGTTSDGLPYLVMEYVEGDPIDVYCQLQGLSVRERVELFRRVCQAVHHAHQNLVVHRDLKAGNILVTPEGAPRLLDFGIAKLLQPSDFAQPLATQPGGAPMTPAYASPEQVLDGAVTTASDVYALGVLLYKLLTDELPYRVAGLTYPQLVRVVCLEDPVAPSRRVLKTASEPTPEQPQGAESEPTLEDPSLARAHPGRRTGRRGLGRRLEGDLDAIVLKAMRKEPSERYDSAARLSEDLQRHLEGLPVEAHRGSWRYYAGKFVRRNKLVIAVALLVTASAILSTFLWRQAETRRREAVEQTTRAERQQERSERLVVLMTRLFRSADPEQTRGAEVTVREVLEQGIESIEEELGDEHDLRAEFFGTMGIVYAALGLDDRALELRRAAVDAARLAYPEGHLELAKLLNNLANVHNNRDEHDKAVALYFESFEMRRRLGVEEHELTTLRMNLAIALKDQGDLVRAEEHATRALELQRAHDGAESVEVAWSLYTLGAITKDQGRLETAEAHYHEALRLFVLNYGEDSLRAARVTSSLGRLLHLRGLYAESQEHFERALAIRYQVEGPEHLHVLELERSYANLLLEQGQASRACELFDRVLSASATRRTPEFLDEVMVLARPCQTSANP